MTIAVEEKRLRSLFERVEVVEDVARTLPEDDERRARLLAVSDSALAEEGTIRPVIAARILGLSEKTVRAWAAAGVLAVARRSPRLLLDVRSVHAVSHLVSELRAAGQDPRGPRDAGGRPATTGDGLSDRQRTTGPVASEHLQRDGQRNARWRHDHDGC